MAKPWIKKEDGLEDKVSELEAEIRHLKNDLIHDPLTGLKTRHYFDEEARKFYEAATSEKLRREWFRVRHVSFIFLDLDHFKYVNDTFGHLAGDAVLKAVAQVIKKEMRDSDVVARWGGEEFIVALLGAGESSALKKADAIRKEVSNLEFDSLPATHVTISAGISTSEVGVSFEEAIDRADKALYAAKESGRNQVVLYSELKKQTKLFS